MSLGKRIDRCTVDEKGRTLRDLLEKSDYEYWGDTLALILTILTNHGIPCIMTKKESDPIFYAVKYIHGCPTKIGFYAKDKMYVWYFEYVDMYYGLSDSFKCDIPSEAPIKSEAFDVLLKYLPEELKLGRFLNTL